MIPLRDENPTRTTPYVVYGLIALNIIAFVYNGPLRAQGGNPLSGFELVPAALTAGQSVAPLTIPAWLTIFTSMFVHANLLHIAGNMLYLWIFGNNIEDVVGHIRFLIFYIIAGIGAAAGQILLNPQSTIPMVGASGAIAGVLGAYFVLFPRARVTSLLVIRIVSLPASVVLGFWILLQLIDSMLIRNVSGGVAYGAHIGGFAAGLLMILVLGGRRLLRRRQHAAYG